MCSKCNLKDHKGTNCINTDETGFKFWAVKNLNGVKNCPGCKARTEKNDGCNHMRCERCGSEWCWICANKIVGTEHYNWRTLEGLFGGCPGLQFALGNKIKLFSFLFGLWLLNIPLAAIVPELAALVASYVLAICFLFYLTERTLPRYDSQYKSFRNFVSFSIGCLLFLSPVFPATFDFIFIVLSAVAVIITALLLAIVCPFLLVYIPFFTVRVTLLSLRLL